MHRETWVGDVEWSEGQILAGLEYRVIHGIQVDRGILKIAAPKLRTSNMDSAVLTVSHEDRPFDGPDNHGAVITLVDIDGRRMIVQVDEAIFEETNVESLAVELTWILYKRLITFLIEHEVSPVRLLFGRRQYHLLNSFLLRRLLHLYLHGLRASRFRMRNYLLDNNVFKYNRT